MADILTIGAAVQRAKSDGLPVSEFSVRCWVRSGKIPVRRIGKKSLLFYPHLVRYLTCEDGADNTPATQLATGIRRIEV